MFIYTIVLHSLILHQKIYLKKSNFAFRIHVCLLSAFVAILGLPSGLLVRASGTGFAEFGGLTIFKRTPVAIMCLHMCCLKNDVQVHVELVFHSSRENLTM